MRFILTVLFSIHIIFVCADTNRDEKRKSLMYDSHGKWHVVWGHTFTEADWIELGLAGAASIVAENPGIIYKWLDYKFQQNLIKIKNDLPEVGIQTLKDWFIQSIRNRQIVTYKGMKFDAGFATYSRWKNVIYDEPRTRKVKRYFGPKRWNKWTWGFEVYTARVKKRIPLPNWHQFYIRYHLVENKRRSYKKRNYISDTRKKIQSEIDRRAGEAKKHAQDQVRQWENDYNNYRKREDTPYKIHIQNNTPFNITVAISYQNNSGLWVYQGWWHLKPGQKQYVAETKNPHAYFHGFGGGYTWGNDIECLVSDLRFKFVGSKTYGQVRYAAFFERKMNTKNYTFAFTFNP